MEKLPRRDFLRYAGIAVAGLFLPKRPRSLELSNPTRQQSFIGINNGHFLDTFSPSTPVRWPLNRGAFDPPEKLEGKSAKRRDPFYLKGERLQECRRQGSNFTMVIEMRNEDTEEHLKEMFDYAHGFLGFRKGDRVVMGNELNDGRNYPIDTYAAQSYFLYHLIKSVDGDIEVGLQADAWNDNIDYFKALIQRCVGGKEKYFPFDFVPLNYYGRPQDLITKVALYRKTMNDCGLNMQIMISEVGVPIIDVPLTQKRNKYNHFLATPEQQASAVWKYLCFAKAAGCSSVFWFAAQDEIVDGEKLPYGLVDIDGNPRPALNELAKAQEIIDKTKQITWQSGNNQYVFYLRGDGLEAKISWTCSQQEELGGPVKVEIKKITR